jgi:hypothetical protein
MIRELPLVDDVDVAELAVELPRRTNFKKLMVFDLDETLVHCCDEEVSSYPQHA